MGAVPRVRSILTLALYASLICCDDRHSARMPGGNGDGALLSGKARPRLAIQQNSPNLSAFARTQMAGASRGCDSRLLQATPGKA